MALTWSDLNHRRDRTLYCLFAIQKTISKNSWQIVLPVGWQIVLPVGNLPSMICSKQGVSWHVYFNIQSSQLWSR